MSTPGSNGANLRSRLRRQFTLMPATCSLPYAIDKCSPSSLVASQIQGEAGCTVPSCGSVQGRCESLQLFCGLLRMADGFSADRPGNSVGRTGAPAPHTVLGVSYPCLRSQGRWTLAQYRRHQCRRHSVETGEKASIRNASNPTGQLLNNAGLPGKCRGRSSQYSSQVFCVMNNYS